MAVQKFRLPGSSYDELRKIILAYSHIKGKASNADISNRVAVDPTVVSRNGGFLVEIGVVESGQKKEITPQGADLAQAMDHGLEDAIRESWLELLEEAPLFETVLSAIRIRGGMDPNTLKSHIAYTAGQKKNSFVMAGAQTVIDILCVAGLLVEEDEQLVASSRDIIVSDSGEITVTSQPVTPKVIVGPSSSRASPVTIQIQIQVTPADLDGLGDKLRKVLDELTQNPDHDDD